MLHSTPLRSYHSDVFDLISELNCSFDRCLQKNGKMSIQTNFLVCLVYLCLSALIVYSKPTSQRVETEPKCGYEVIDLDELICSHSFTVCKIVYRNLPAC